MQKLQIFLQLKQYLNLKRLNYDLKDKPRGISDSRYGINKSGTSSGGADVEVGCLVACKHTATVGRLKMLK